MLPYSKVPCASCPHCDVQNIYGKQENSHSNVKEKLCLDELLSMKGSFWDEWGKVVDRARIPSYREDCLIGDEDSDNLIDRCSKGVMDDGYLSLSSLQYVTNANDHIAGQRGMSESHYLTF